VPSWEWRLARTISARWTISSSLPAFASPRWREPLYAPEDLETLLQERQGGAEVQLEVLRDDTVFQVELLLRDSGEPGSARSRELFRVDPARTRAAWATGPSGVVLVSSAAGGPTQKAGLEVGTTVVALDGERVASDRGMIRRLLGYRPGSKVEFSVVEGERVERAVVKLHQPREVTTRFTFPILWNYHSDRTGARTEFVLIDLWILSLFRYTRVGQEKEWSFLGLWKISSGVGDLAE
jgi:membrane-associated protease RseP (regulator of RpoE activity)